MNDKNYENINIKIVIKYMAIYPYTKFQDFGTKFAQKNMNEKNFKKINVKIVISI